MPRWRVFTRFVAANHDECCKPEADSAFPNEPQWDDIFGVAQLDDLHPTTIGMLID